MPPTTATLEYDVNVVGSQAQAAIHLELEDVVLDYDATNALGYGFISDVTTNPTATRVARTITLSLIQPTLQNDNNPYTVPTGMAGATVDVITNFIGEIHSSSPDDAAGGIGAQTVTVNYLDAADGAHAQVVALDGETPVSLVTDDHATIVSIIITTVGTFGTSVGSLVITTAPGTPPFDCCPPNIGTLVANLPAGSYNNDPTGTGAALFGVFTGQLQSAIGSPVIAQPPVLA